MQHVPTFRAKPAQLFSSRIVGPVVALLDQVAATRFPVRLGWEFPGLFPGVSSLISR